MLGQASNLTACSLLRNQVNDQNFSSKFFHNQQNHFEKEKVTSQGHSFCSLKLNYFILFYILGKDFCKIETAEIPHQSNRVTKVDIPCIQRANQLLTIDRLSAATFEEDGHLYCTSAKVCVVNNGGDKAGYIFTSNKKQFKIQLVDNSIIE